MHVWKKTVRTHNLARWTEGLASSVDPERLVIREIAGGSSSHLEVYAEREAELRPLRKNFGGMIALVRPESWQPRPLTKPGKPLSIGGRLLIAGRKEDLSALRRFHPTKSALCIPAAMAFGTGEHATTAMCIRLLSEVARRRAAEKWDLLDLGTGSGILALAGKLFDARNVLGLDNDPHAVRIAQENAELNGLADRSVRFARAELPAWPKRPARTWPVVTANLFSELLVKLLPDVIAPAVSPGGDLILSGVLGTQTADVLAAAEACGLKPLVTKQRGRWRAFHLRQPLV